MREAWRQPAKRRAAASSDGPGRKGKATGLALRGGQLWEDAMLVVTCFCGALGLVEEDMRPWRGLNLVNLGKWHLGCRYWVMETHDPVLVMGNCAGSLQPGGVSARIAFSMAKREGKNPRVKKHHSLLILQDHQLK